jgi:Long-chain acyl-CoA synthetases (AMP-forming)
MLLRRVAKTPDREAYLRPVPDGWEPLTWRQVGERVRAIACGLRALGLEDEERASILASTRLEWILADLGILSAGGATTTIYPSTTTPDALFILQDSDTRILFAENPEQAERIARERSKTPGLKAIVLLEGEGSPDGFVLTTDALMEKGAPGTRRIPAVSRISSRRSAPRPSPRSCTPRGRRAGRRESS